MENLNRTVAERIKNMRKERGYTIRDLSIKTDIAEASLSGYEHGKKGIGLKSLISLADALNVSLDYLTGRSEEPYVYRATRRALNDEEMQRERFLADMGEVYDRYMDAGQGTVDIESSEQARTEAVEHLKTAIKDGEWKEPLWNAIELHQGVEYRMGMLIKHISSLIVKDYKIDGRNIILICSLVLTCSVGVLDWKLCLLILAVIMGKFIWIDFVFEFEEIRDEIRKIVTMIRHDIGVEYMAFHLSMWFLGLFIGFTIMYLSFMKSAPVYMIFVYLLSLISVDISNSSQSNVDNLFFNNEEVKKH